MEMQLTCPKLTNATRFHNASLRYNARTLSPMTTANATGKDRFGVEDDKSPPSETASPTKTKTCH